MKIAILATTSPSGEQSGAERFYQELRTALTEKGNTADVLSFVCDESDFFHIKKSYLRFYDLDLCDYDAVISTRAPGYVIRHPNHLCYLQQTMRVFYDVFDFGLASPTRELKENRRLIHRLDTLALQPPRTRRIFTISHEISNRLRAFNGLESEVLYQAPTMKGFRQGDYLYVFLPGRLQRWKRANLIVEAMRFVHAPVELVISGAGEDEATLRAIAKGDGRIHFVGRVSDEDLLELYSNALAVAFVPIREDFGLITLEAFHSHKPVITCSDAGEPVRIVRHEKTGFVCAPDPRDIARRIDQLAADRDLAHRMGQRAAESIQDISWERVAGTLLDALESGVEKGMSNRLAAKSNALPPEPTITVLDMQPIDPPLGGGRARLLGLYHGLDSPTTYVGTYDWPGESDRDHKLSPSLREVDIPLSKEHHAAATELSSRLGGKPVIDAAFHRFAHLSTRYKETAAAHLSTANVIVFSHPWVYPMVRDRIDRDKQLLVYDSHNVEGYLKYTLLGDAGAHGRQLSREVAEIEAELCSTADLVLACSEGDRERFNKVYGLSKDKVIVVPNGVFTSRMKPAQAGDVAIEKRKLKLSDRYAAIFIGSNYAPNVEAAVFLISSVAPKFPKLTIIIVGGVGQGLPKHIHVPKNVRIMGVVSEKDKQSYLHASDLALNPMFSGSGTNVKMFDFMAAGLPIVATRAGARGIDYGRNHGILVAEDSDFCNVVARVLSDPSLRASTGKSAREFVEKAFSWEKISADLGIRIRQLYQCHGQPHRRLAMMSSFGTVCGISEYSNYLLAALRKLLPHAIVGLGTNCVDSSAQTEYTGIDALAPVWHFDNKSWRNSSVDRAALKRTLREWNIGHLNIQYHPGFFNREILLKIAKDATTAGIKLSITFHNIESLTDNWFASLLEINPQIFLHEEKQCSRLRGLGFPHVTYLAHGIIECADEDALEMRRQLSLRGDPIIGSFGFLRPYKGLLELIYAMPNVRSAFPDAALLALNSRYPSPDSEAYERKCRQAIQHLGLGDCVYLDTNYLPISEVIRRLHATDIAVFPYHASEESASGAANVCIAARRPFLVSKSAIFSDITDLSATFPSLDPAQIANVIVGTLNDPSVMRDLRKKVNSASRSRSWPSVAERFLQFISFSTESSTGCDCLAE